MMCAAVADETTKHIASLVSRQKGKKSRGVRFGETKIMQIFIHTSPKIGMGYIQLFFQGVVTTNSLG